jgi:lysylphosphatidylglycerol synthetase-like protein (DUF2156 family)
VAPVASIARISRAIAREASPFYGLRGLIEYLDNYNSIFSVIN